MEAKQTKQSTESAAQAEVDQNAVAEGQQEVTAENPEAAQDAVNTDLAVQLAEAQAKATEHYDAFLRANAEMQNIRRRATEDVAKAHKFAIESFAEALVPVMDSLHAAIDDTSADAAKVREGVALTMRQLVSAFEKGKIKEINPVGEKFDPHQQQAIAMVPSEQEPNTVVSVLQRGYTIADRVLRPALVTVSQAK